MSNERRLDQAVGRLRAVVAGEGDAANDLFASDGGGELPAALAERLARLESKLDELAPVLGGLDKTLRTTPASDLEAIAGQLRAELAYERSRRRRATLGLLALALLAGAAGWLWGDALDPAGLRGAAEERAAALVELVRVWLSGA